MWATATIRAHTAHTQRLAEHTGQAFSFFSSRCKGRVQKVREGRRGGRGISFVLCCERKERYVERLWTTTTNSITDDTRQDKGRNYVSERAIPCTPFWRSERDTKIAITWAIERFLAHPSGAARETKIAVTWASERFRAHRSGAEREEGSVELREQKATSHKPVIKRNGNGALHNSSLAVKSHTI